MNPFAHDKLLIIRTRNLRKRETSPKTLRKLKKELMQIKPKKKSIPLPQRKTDLMQQLISVKQKEFDCGD